MKDTFHFTEVDVNHLQTIKCGYFRHCYMAMYFNFLLFVAVITGTIHAFFPFLFPFTPYKLAKKVTDGTEQYFIHNHNK